MPTPVTWLEMDMGKVLQALMQRRDAKPEGEFRKPERETIHHRHRVPYRLLSSLCLW